MTKQTIAVDVDDVLLPHFQDIATWYNREYDTHLTLADNNSTDLHVWGATSEKEAILRVHKFFESEVFLSGVPFRAAKDALTQLSTRFDLIVVTARDTLIEVMTRSWLDEHFAEVFKGAYFTAKFNLEGKRRSKADVLLEARAAYLIDDSPDNILAAHEAGVQCILFGEYPWNIDADMPANVVRCKDWSAVLEYFERKNS